MALDWGNKISYLAVTNNAQLNQWHEGDYEGECIKIWNVSYHTKNVFNQQKKLLLPCCYRRCSIELTKQWMTVMKYGAEWIKDME